MYKIFIDANVLINHDKNVDTFFKELLELYFKDEAQLYCNFVVRFEYLVGIPTSKRNMQKALKKFLFLQDLLLSDDIVFNATRIGRKYQIGMADCLIATTCLEHNLYLATHNKKHFSKIRRLKFWEK